MRCVINYFGLYSNPIVFFMSGSGGVKKNFYFNVSTFFSGVVAIPSRLFKSGSYGGFLESIFLFFAYLTIF